MKSSQGVNKGFTQSPGGFRRQCETARQFAAQNHSAYTLHQVKRRADHGFVRAKKQRLWGRIGAVQFAEHVVLTPHIMRVLYLAAEWRPAQHHLFAAKRHGVSKIGVSAGKLLYL